MRAPQGTVAGLPTPSLLIERERLEANLLRMQRLAERNRVRLRPHIKTHKSIAIARRQSELGASGITVAKPGEAEVFVAAGFDDVRIAYPVVGSDKLERLLRLMERARISFCVESAAGAQAASDFFAGHGVAAEVLLKVDCGYGRVGVGWDDDEAVALARRVAELPGLELIGLLTHAGHSYHGPHPGETELDALRRVACEERDRMRELARRLTSQGEVERAARLELSIGSSPTMAVFENAEPEPAIDEIRPGTYVFQDLTQVALGAAQLTDCALTVLTTVVSARRRNGGTQVILDAGRKVLTSDQRHGASSYGLLLADAGSMTPLAGAEIFNLSEEHAWVSLPQPAELKVGDRVRVVPNHVCVAVNTQDQMTLVEGERVIEQFAVDARGRVT